MKFASAAAFEKWLRGNHASRTEIWIQFAKKDSGHASISNPQAIEVALCFGWIDGQRKPLDSEWYLQRYTPRSSRSRWSKINREKALALIAARKMHAAGLAEIEKAKADGRWDSAYDSPRNVKAPPEFARALKSQRLEKKFAEQSSANRYAMLYRLQHAKKAETRDRLVAKFIEMLKRGERFH